MGEGIPFFAIILLTGPGILFFTSMVVSDDLKKLLITAAGTDLGHFLIIFSLLMGLDFIDHNTAIMPFVQIASCLYVGYLGVRYFLQKPSKKGGRRLDTPHAMQST